MIWIYLILIGVVLVFGVGVLLVNRRRSVGELPPVAVPLSDRTSEIVRPPRQLDLDEDQPATIEQIEVAPDCQALLPAAPAAAESKPAAEAKPAAKPEAAAAGEAAKSAPAAVKN